MRFYLVSFFLHFSLLLLGFLFSQGSSIPAHSHKNHIQVEMISLPDTNTPKSSTPKPQKRVLKRKPIAKKLLAKKAKTTKNKIKEEAPIKEDMANNTDQQEEQEATETSHSTSLTYAQELKLFLEKNKHYPRQAIRLKQAGVVIIKVNISSNGGFKNVEVTGPSSFPILNQATVKLLNKLGKFKPLPKKFKGDTQFTIPVSYGMGGA